MASKNLVFAELKEWIYSNGSADLITEQNKEIEKLRSEINDAFENYEEKTRSEKGIIVQPGWTEAIKFQSKGISHVHVTNKSLIEAQILRSEINKAIEQDTYVASIARTSAGNTNHVKILNQKFNRPASKKSSRGKQKIDESKVLLNSRNTKEVDNTKPNVVNSNAFLEPDIDIRKLHRLQISKRRTREVLILKSIEEDFNFLLVGDVEEWAYIVYNKREYFIGRCASNLVIVRIDLPNYHSREIVYVNQSISYFETFLFWNLEQQQQEGIIIVTTKDKILWYRSNNETEKIELYWQWTVDSIINSLTYFSVESSDYLAVSSSDSSRLEHNALNIYKFELQYKEFWIVQRIKLQVACRIVSVLDTGRDIILAVAQNNFAIIYMFNPHKDSIDHIRFQLRHRIQSERVEVITVFQMGGRYYVAIGGNEPKIFLYQGGRFIPKTVLGNNFGLVEFFLPIPARTYRDDLILLVQHRVDFGSHDIVVLESLIWDGEAFEATIPIPCYLGDDIIYGINCMLDTQRDAGLKGAALLRRGSEMSIIVPRYNAESGVFRLHFDLLVKNSEWLDLQDILNFLKEWVKEQDVLIGTVQEFLEIPLDQTLKQAKKTTYIEHITTSELYFGGVVNEIYLSSYKWMNNDTGTNLGIIIKAIEQLENTINSGRQKREVYLSSKYYGTLIVENLKVVTLLLKFQKSDKFYVQEGSLNFIGVLSLNSVEVLKNVIIRQSRKILNDFFGLNGDIVFTEVNNFLWNNTERNLVFHTDFVKISSLKVKENILLEDDFAIEVLNSIHFPNEYLWSSGTTTCIIKLDIIFAETLIAGAIDSEGVINDMDPFNAITISDQQVWNGTPTFIQLEVPENFRLSGSAQARDFELSHKNPSLIDDNIILSNCNFEYLEVNGTVYLKDNFGENLSTVLTDIVQASFPQKGEIHMTSKKIFLNIEFPIDFLISLDAITEIPVSQFITLNTTQSLSLSVLEHYVYFEQIKLIGLYNEINIKKLFSKKVKINEQQNILATQLNFAHSINVHHINISSSLNGEPVKIFQMLNYSFHAHSISLTALQTEVLHFQRNIYRNAALNAIELQSFLYYNKNVALCDMFLQELLLNDALNSDELYSIHEYYFFNFLNRIDELPEMILNGKIQVEHFIVTGDVQLSQLNDSNFDEQFQLQVIWLNRQNYLGSYSFFLEPVVMQIDLLILKSLNSYNFLNLLDDIIFRTNDKTTIILPNKNFEYDVYVFGNINAAAINRLHVQFIGTKETVKNFYGSLDIKGSLFTHSFKIKNELNMYHMSLLSTCVHYNNDWKYFELVGDVLFYQQMNLNDINVSGNLGNIDRFYDFLNELLLKNDICDLKGKNSFMGRVTIIDDIFMGVFNVYGLHNILTTIAFIHDISTVLLSSKVVFHTSAYINLVDIFHGLNTTILRDCSLTKWLQETWLVDRYQNISQRLSFTTGGLDSNSFYISFLNNSDLSQIIQLYLEQYLTEPIFYALQLEGEFITKGLINNLNQLKEYNNTYF